jgi:gamma-glutamyltranspeptidase / glutathione hydrolase
MDEHQIDSRESVAFRRFAFKEEGAMLKFSFIFVIMLPLLCSYSKSAQTMRAEINAKSYAIAAGRHFAVEAGMRTFRNGGNAFDAGAAAVLAASVTEIQLFGFGGEAPVVLYDARRKQVLVANGQGVAPAAAKPEAWAGRPSIYSGRRQSGSAKPNSYASAMRNRLRLHAPP